MSTEKQTAASRANGAKSQGPTTPEGKAISSKNALFHGLTSQSFILPDEDPDAAGLMLDSYVASLQPQGAVETDLAREVALARWRLFRVARVEAGLVEKAVDERAGQLNSQYGDPGQDVHVIIAMEQLLIGPSCILDRLGLYETRLRRFYTRALRELLALQKRRRDERKNEPGDAELPPNQQTIPPELPTADLRIAPVDRPVGTDNA